MKYTKNYNFKKPEPYDTRNINDINDSFDLVDAKLKETQDKNVNLDETFKQLIIDKGNSNAEIVASRRDKINNKTHNSLPDRLDSVSSQLAQKANETKVKVLEVRMDSFASLPNGSTAGDAELIDGRIDVNGKVHESMGTALRTQIADKLDKYIYEKASGTAIEVPGSINGTIILNAWTRNLANGSIKGITPLTLSLKKGTYTLSFDGVNGKTKWSLYARLKDAVGDVIKEKGHLICTSSTYDLSSFSTSSGYYYGRTEAVKVYTFVLDNDYTVDFLFSGNSDTVDNTSINTMLELSPSKTVFVPHSGYTVTSSNTDGTATNDVFVTGDTDSYYELKAYIGGTVITNEYGAPIEVMYPVDDVGRVIEKYRDTIGQIVDDMPITFDTIGEFVYKSNSDIYVKITSIEHNTLMCYGVKDGVRYPLPITSITTGSSHTNIAYTGVYYIKTLGFNSFVFTCDRTAFDCVASIVSYVKKPTIEQMVRSQNVINTPNVDKKFISGMTIWGVRNGKYLGTRVVSGVLTVYEIDRDTLTETKKGTIVPSGAAQPLQCEILENGTVLFILSYGYSAVVRSTDLATWTVVGSLKNFAYVYGSFRQIDSHGSNVILSEYLIPANYTNPADATGRKLYLSKDSGATFTPIFDLATLHTDFTTTHIHSIAFDKWNDNTIWVVTGDGRGHKMIYYTVDLGVNWYQAADFDDVNLQMTSIIPLKNCVLFGSDCPVTGIARFNRPVTGIVPGQKLDFDMPFFIEPNWQGTVPVASRPYINYKNSTAFFGFTLATTSSQGHLNNGQVYATNGYDFKEVYRSETAVSVGVPAIYGDEESRKVIAKQGLSENFVLIDMDIFN